MASLSDPLVQELLNGRYVATLGTHNPDGSIHMVAVWYVFHVEHLWVATASGSKKAKNVAARPQASLMVDSRDPQASCGITVMGAVEMVTGEESRRVNALIHERYLSPEAMKDARIGPVFAQWDDVTLKLKPEKVIAWDMREADRQVFGNAFAQNPGYLRELPR